MLTAGFLPVRWLPEEVPQPVAVPPAHAVRSVGVRPAARGTPTASGVEQHGVRQPVSVLRPAGGRQQVLPVRQDRRAPVQQVHGQHVQQARGRLGRQAPGRQDLPAHGQRDRQGPPLPDRRPPLPRAAYRRHGHRVAALVVPYRPHHGRQAAWAAEAVAVAAAAEAVDNGLKQELKPKGQLNPFPEGA